MIEVLLRKGVWKNTNLASYLISQEWFSRTVTNKRQDRIKAIWFETGGLVIWYKRLENGTLELPKVAAEQAYLTIDVAQLAMLLAGVPLDHARRRTRMQLPNELAECQRLIVELRAHLCTTKSPSAAVETVFAIGSLHSIQQETHLTVQTSRPVSELIPSPVSELTQRLANAPLASPESQRLSESSQVSPNRKLPPQLVQLEDLVAQVRNRDTQMRDRNARLSELAKTILALQDARLGLQQENEKLRLTLDKLLKQIYGQRGERFVEDPTQKKLALDFGDDPQTEDAFPDAIEEAQKVISEVESRRKAKKPVPQKRSEKLPGHLPRVEKIIDVP